MGSACCVAAREHHDTPLPSRTTSVRRSRNVRNSHRWDSSRGRGRVAEELQNVPCLNSGGTSSLDYSMDAECGSISEQKSPVDCQALAVQKSPNCTDASFNSISSTPEPSVDCSLLNEAEDLREQSTVADPLASRLSFSAPLTPSSCSMPYGDSSAQRDLPSVESTASWQTNHSPGYYPRRHVFVGQPSNLRSPNNSASRKRESFNFSPFGGNFTVGSQGGASSDGWSMSTFSDLVASSQRDRWSFDTMDCSREKIIRSKNNTLTTPSIDLSTCGVCLKLLMERSPWVAQKFVFSNELSVAAVLICGHVYHAECLENTTSESSKFDPPCPICTPGEKQAVKIPGRSVKFDTEYKAKHRKSRNRIKDGNFGSEPSVLDHQRSNRQEGKSPTLGSSSSVKHSFTGPFLRRHFSLGSKSNKSLLESEFSVKSPRKGFWAKYRKS